MKMVRAEIKARLEAVEHLSKHVEVPDLVMIYKDSSGSGWTAQETYVKKTAQGAVIPGSGTNKIIPLDCPESYRPPEGFKGVIMTEGEFDDE